MCTHINYIISLFFFITAYCSLEIAFNLRSSCSTAVIWFLITEFPVSASSVSSEYILFLKSLTFLGKKESHEELLWHWLSVQ